VGEGGETLLGEQPPTVTVSPGVQLLASLDKPMYQPGQTVRARVLAYNPALQPVEQDILLTVEDPKGFKIFKASARSGASGVVAFDLPMASEATLGAYKVTAEAGAAATEAAFDLEKYTLPRFEVTVELDQALLTGDSSSRTQGRNAPRTLSGRVTAAYTYGKPVRGTVSLVAQKTGSSPGWGPWRGTGLMDERQPGGRPAPGAELAKLDGLHIDGTATFDLELDAGAQLYAGQQVNVTAVVTDEATGDTEDGEALVDVLSGDTEVTLTVDEKFKPGLPLVGEVSAKDAAGLPVSGRYKAEVTLRTSSWSRDPVVHESRDIDVGESGRAAFEIEIPLGEHNTKCCSAAWLAGADSMPDGVDHTCCVTHLELTLYRYTDEKAKQRAASACVERSFSPSGMYLSASRLSDPAESDPKNPQVTIAVTTSGVVTAAAEGFSPSALHYTVTTREGVTSSGTEPWDGATGALPRSLAVPVESSWSPEARIFVFFVAPSGEVIGDSVLVTGLGKHLESSAFVARFASSSARPGDVVKVAIEGGSQVYLRSVDASMKLLSDKDTGVTASGVSQRLRDFLPSPVTDFAGLERDNTAGSAAAGAAGFVVASSSSKNRPPWATACFPSYILEDMPMPMMAAAPEMMRSASAELKESAESEPPGDSGAGSAAEETTRVRKFFPETWIWTDVTCSASASDGCSVETVAPDTITSWELDAFSMGSEQGLQVAPPAEPLTVFKPFFSLLSLPRVAKRQEWIEVSAAVFNYGQQSVVAQTSLSLPATIILEGDATQSLFIESGSSKTAYFNISATSVGIEDILFTARVVEGTGTGSDAVQRPLEVEAEGLVQELTTNAVLDPSEPSGEALQFETSFPQEAVEGSAHASVSIVGDLLGPTLDGLERLVRLPTGCGEQTMITFAPQVYVTGYLDAVNSLPAELRKNLQSNIAVGLQRELTYRHEDGSFSAFGESDDSGSTWLTAFVLKSFAQASAFSFVDSEVLVKATEFLLNSQLPDGSFRSIGKVIHEDMMGGVSGADGKASLTSFCLVALLEAAKASSQVEAKMATFDKPLERAVSFLLESAPLARGAQGRNSGKQAYAAAISAYALALARSYRPLLLTEETLSATMSELKSLGVAEDGLVHWGGAGQDETPAACPRWSSHCGGDSAAVETTAYALLAMLSGARSDGAHLAEALPAARWLIQQRNSNGGFRSTQDTVVGLESLSSFATQAYQSGVDLTVTISSLDSDWQESVRVSNQNRDVVQRLELPLGQRIRALAEGSGQVAFTSTVEFNVLEMAEEPRFDFSVAWSAVPAKATKRKMKAHVAPLGGGKGGMAVMELGLFTGTAVTAGSLSALRADRRVKRLEVEPTKLVLYFDEILKGETIELEAETVSPVANLQPASSIVYEYYQPENQALAISRSDDSSETFVRVRAMDGEEVRDDDSAAGVLAPKLFSAAAGAGIALMALV
jgi:CD109 antigen